MALVQHCSATALAKYLMKYEKVGEAFQYVEDAIKGMERMWRVGKEKVGQRGRRGDGAGCPGCGSVFAAALWGGHDERKGGRRRSPSMRAREEEVLSGRSRASRSVPAIEQERHAS